ncbi:hypothetical protein [Merismopedia glauca]|uniref:hypothetical protein n=1 Tax=Merismopedia glauca TaxID=292586 RepID=UPI001C636038|nr:hypothetical protein [Merismopedia glauca]
MNIVKGNYIKVLLALLVAIAPVLVLDYRPSGAQSSPSSTPAVNQTNNAFNQLKKSRDELKASLDKFKEAIKKAVKDKKLNGIDSQEVTAKIAALKTAKTDFFKSETSAQSKETATQIDEAIAAISQVIDPLNQGLTKTNEDKIAQVQRYLKLDKKDQTKGKFSEPPNKKGYGDFGDATQGAIDTFLTDEFGKLDNAINQLENLSAEKPTVNSDKPTGASKEKTASDNNSSNWFPLFAAALFGAILGSIASIFGAEFFRRRSQIPTQQTPPKTQESQSTESSQIKYLNARIDSLTTNGKTDSGRIENLENQIRRLQGEVIALSHSGSSNVTSTSWEINPTPSPYQNPISLPFDDPQAYSAVSYETNTPQASQTPQLVDIYNHNPRSLSGKAIEVGETEESINNRRLSGNQLAILENKRGGSYWIIKEDSIDYMLPKQNLKINEYNYSTVEVLFECRNYDANYSDYKLVKPARVQMVSGGTWQLQERGIIEFY